MKKNILYLLLSPFALGSCTLEEELNLRNDNFIHVNAYNEEQSDYTRSTTGQKIYHKWNNGDALGLYAKGVLNEGGASVVNMGNQKMTASVSGNNVSFGKLPFQWSNDPQDFYIYYPHQADSQNDYSDQQIKVMGSLSSMQTQAGAYEKSENNGYNFLYRIYKGISKPGDGTLYLRDFSSFFPTYQFTVLCTDKFYANMEVKSLEISANVPLNTGSYSIDLTKVGTGISALQWDEAQMTTTVYKVELESGIKLAYNMPVNIFATLPPAGMTTLTCKLLLKDDKGQTYTIGKTMENQNLTVGKSVYTYILMGDEIPPSEPKETANCYILKPEQEIYIPVSQINVANAFNANIPAVSSDEVLISELVWTDVKGSESGKGLAPDASVAEIRVIGKGPQAVLAVKAGTKFGNSVIAVRSTKENSIKWSWHIWVTDYNPDKPATKIEDGLGTFTTGGGDLLMDRNLGAISATPSSTNNGLIGNYYQWGRKDPFPTAMNGAIVTVYNAQGNPVTRGTAASSIPDLVKNPYHWTTAQTYQTSQLWGNDGANDANGGVIGNKTVYDPCPSGWRVPRVDAYIDLLDNVQTTVRGMKFPLQSGKGRQGIRTGYFPQTGSLAANGNLTMDSKINVWTSFNSLYFYADLSSTVNVMSNTASFGFPVRCVKDFKSRPENEVRVMIYNNAWPYSRTYNTKSFNTYTGVNGPHSTCHGVYEFLKYHFSPNQPANVSFRCYSFDERDSRDVTLLMEQYNINVLHIIYDTAAAFPAQSQAQKIMNWLEKDKHRVLLLSGDYGSSFIEIMKLANLSTSGVADYTDSRNIALLKANKVDHPAYDKMTNGLYGDIANWNFNGIQLGSGLNEARAIQNGYVPVLRLNKPGLLYNIWVAVHPERRIVYYGDTQIMSYAYGQGGEIGPYDWTGKPKAGNEGHAVWQANMWTWISEQVLGKEFK